MQSGQAGKGATAVGLVVALVVILLALMVAAAALAAAEVALLRTPRVSVEVAVDNGSPQAATMLRLLDDLPLVLNTVLLTVLFAQVGAAAITGYLAQRWFGGLATTVATVVLTLTLFVYTEAIPKTLAVRSPLGYGLAVARPLAVAIRPLSPLTRVLLRAADAQTPGTGASARTAFSEEELRLLAAQSAEAGEIDAADAELVERSFEFGDTRVAEVFVPREDVVAVAESTTPADAVERAVRSGHRRLPVFRGDIDTITGVVRLRDLAQAAQSGEPTTVEALGRPTLSVGPDALVADVLGRMQRTGRRFAVVTSPAGTTEGIITIDDIVAELVGEIQEPD